MICNDTILFSLIKIKRKERKYCRKLLRWQRNSRTVQVETQQNLVFIYLKKKPPVSVHVDEREKIIFYSFWSLFVPNFIGLLVRVHFPIVGIVGTRVKKSFFLIYFPSVIRRKHKFCHFNHIFLFLKWSFTLITFYEHTSIFLHSISRTRPPLHLSWRAGFVGRTWMV